MAQAQIKSVKKGRYIVLRYIDKQFEPSVAYSTGVESKYPQKEIYYTDDVPGEIKSFVDVYRVDYCLDSPMMMVFREESYPPGGGSMVLHLKELIATIYTESISEDPMVAKKRSRAALNKLLNKIIEESPDGIGILNIFVKIAQKLIEPYSTRGISARVIDIGGDYPAITVIACYLG